MSNGNPTQEPVASGLETRAVSSTEKVGLLIDGRYRITGLIGRGGMGSVYRAEHVATRRTVALKLLHPSLVGVREVAKRFEREAFAIGRIKHPNCVDVSDFGELEDGALYLVMEYIDGESLGNMIDAQGRLGWQRALHITRHVLRGLGHAHEADIVHRDVKPENVLVCEQDGDPDFAKILDFGIAKLIGEAKADGDEVKLTQAGVAFGTPVYMSPEQAVGNPVDGRADLYAATILLFEMITGKPPFYSDDKLEVLSMHTTRPPPSPYEVAPGLEKLPAGVEELIEKGLAKRPGDRFANASEFVAAIDELLGEPPAAGGRSRPAPRPGTVPVTYGRATTLAQEMSESGGRRKLYLMLGGIGVLVAIALLAAVLASGGDRRKAQREPEPEAPAAEPEVTRVARAEAALARGDAAEALSLLSAKSDQIAGDPRAQLVLGHAHSAKRDHKRALGAYRKALELDPTLRDEQMAQNLRVLLESSDGMDAIAAAELLVVRLGDPKARAMLVKIPSDWKWSYEARQRALVVTEKAGLIDKVDLYATYKIDLEQPSHCNTRALAVPKLRLLGDKRAIEELKAAIKRKGRAGRYKGKPINLCLAKAAREAIKVLESGR